jgi:ABC-type phosphate transport system substrate-binding protein
LDADSSQQFDPLERSPDRGCEPEPEAARSSDHGRSHASGTTFVFTKHLAAINDTFAKQDLILQY